jgi:hypothetical protein
MASALLIAELDPELDEFLAVAELAPEVRELLEDEARSSVWVAHVIEHAKGEGVDVVYNGRLFYRTDDGELYDVGVVPALEPEVGEAAVEELLRDGEPDFEREEYDLVPLWKTDPRDALKRVRRRDVGIVLSTPGSGYGLALPACRRTGTRARASRPAGRVRRLARTARGDPSEPGEPPSRLKAAP